MPFAVALSGLNAASSDLSVTANNIANANTTGFKASRAEFADVFAVGAQNIGNGVAMSSVTQEFSQGGVDFTINRPRVTWQELAKSAEKRPSWGAKSATPITSAPAASSRISSA